MTGRDQRGLGRVAARWTSGVAALMVLVAPHAARADSSVPVAQQPRAWPGPSSADHPSRPVPHGTASTIEAADPELASSLALVTLVPTAENHRRVGGDYLRLHVLDAAYEHFTAAVQLEPTDGLAHVGLAAVWRGWGFDDWSLAEAYRAVYFARSSAAAHNALGVALASLGHPDDARRALNEARRLDPAASYPVANLCAIALEQDQVVDALALCEDAVLLDSVAPATHTLFGLTLARTGEFARAHEEFLKAGTRAAAAYELGLAYLRAGRADDAARAFRSIVLADPKARDAAARLRLLATQTRGPQ
jgi:Flp pilus assembly protein TadD